MASVHPFQGYRADPPRVARVAAPPYDVLSEDEARRFAENNPDCFLRVTRPEILAPPASAGAADDLDARAAAEWARMLGAGLFEADVAPAYRVYRLTQGAHCQTGVMAAVDAADFDARIVRRHELTRRAKEDERARHIEALGLQSGPVLLAHRAHAGLRERVGRIATTVPLYDFESATGVRHTLWEVGPGEEQEALRRHFREVAALYIADGHHRAAAALRVRDRGRAGGAGPYGIMAVLFPDDELRILGYHRVIELGGRSPVALREQLAQDFHIVPTAAPEPPVGGEFGMYLEGQWARLRPRFVEAARPDSPKEALDASVLQRRVLEPLLGLGDIRSDPRADFVGGARGLAELERRCAAGDRVAFALAPVTMAQIMAVSDRDRIMPPKSTWFEPKLLSGLALHAGRMKDEGEILGSDLSLRRCRPTR